MGARRTKGASWLITLYCDKCGKPGLPCFCDEALEEVAEATDSDITDVQDEYRKWCKSL